MKPVCFVLHCAAALALFGMANSAMLGRDTAQAQGAGGACSATPCHLPNLFDPELDDLKSYNNQPLDAVIKGALDAVKSGGSNDQGCHPDPVTLTIFTKPGSDPSFTTFIASSRMGALVKYFEGNGVSLNSIYPVSAPASASNGPGSDGTADVIFNNIDRDPPILKTNSKPPKGTKVKKGDRIEVHATASERYADGHNSWPSGVKSIQLIANGTLFKSEDYGMKPPPCEVRHFDPVYTVPSNPPPVVHLRVLTEDAVGHPTFEEADFPTGDWYGTFTWSGRAPVPSGPQDWDGHADLALDDDGKGGLTGTLIGTQTQKLGLAKCHAFTQGTMSAALTGTISAQRITINVPNGQSNWPANTPCAEGLSAGTGGPVFKWPHLGDVFRGLTPSADGSLHFDQQWTIPQGPYVSTVHYTLTLRRAEH